VIGLCAPDVLVSMHRIWLGGGGKRTSGLARRTEGGWTAVEDRVEEGRRAARSDNGSRTASERRKKGGRHSGRNQLNEEKCRERPAA
jgi:hypothetical protein